MSDKQRQHGNTEQMVSKMHNIVWNKIFVVPQRHFHKMRILRDKRNLLRRDSDGHVGYRQTRRRFLGDDVVPKTQERIPTITTFEVTEYDIYEHKLPGVIFKNFLLQNIEEDLKELSAEDRVKLSYPGTRLLVPKREQPPSPDTPNPPVVPNDEERKEPTKPCEFLEDHIFGFCRHPSMDDICADKIMSIECVDCKLCLCADLKAKGKCPNPPPRPTPEVVHSDGGLTAMVMKDADGFATPAGKLPDVVPKEEEHKVKFGADRFAGDVNFLFGRVEPHPIMHNQTEEDAYAKKIIDTYSPKVIASIIRQASKAPPPEPTPPMLCPNPRSTRRRLTARAMNLKWSIALIVVKRVLFTYC